EDNIKRVCEEKVDKEEDNAEDIRGEFVFTKILTFISTITTNQEKLNHSILEKDRLKKSLEQKKTNILRSSDKLQNLINSIEKDCEELKGLKNAEESNDKESIIIKENIEEEKILIEHLNAECFENEKTRRHLHNVVQNLKGNIRVFCRVRPQTSAEKDVPLTDIEYPEKCEKEDNIKRVYEKKIDKEENSAEDIHGEFVQHTMLIELKHHDIKLTKDTDSFAQRIIW
ncbi:1768_t:CDS:2, partial [Entrophospora sp. SA101]